MVGIYKIYAIWLLLSLIIEHCCTIALLLILCWYVVYLVFFLFFFLVGRRYAFRYSYGRVHSVCRFSFWIWPPRWSVRLPLSRYLLRSRSLPSILFIIASQSFWRVNSISILVKSKLAGFILNYFHREVVISAYHFIYLKPSDMILNNAIW